MGAPKRYFRTSAQQVDPLSWFTGPYLPLVFAGGIFVFGTTVTIITWGISEQPWLQLAGLWLCVLAGLLIFERTGPLERPLGWGTAALALATATVGTALSAIDYSMVDINLGLWWGPSGPALIILGLAPYLSTRRILVLGIATTVGVVVVSSAYITTAAESIGQVVAVFSFAYPPAMATAGAALFSYSVVSTVLPILESPSRIKVIGPSVRDEMIAEVEHVTLARLTARAAPFLLGIAEAGTVTPTDRALAGQLARRLRDDLVTQANESWLELEAKGSRLVVVDPDRLAREMTTAQRTALLALLRATLDLPETDNGSFLIELRKAADGSTAVAMSMDMALPEGRRIMHLAPYYLSLKTAVDDLTFDRHRLTFRMASDDGAR